MDAKEFFEKNRGKYFDYQGHKVRVVGMSSTSSPILVSGFMYGWYISNTNRKLINFIDNSLVKNNDKLWFVDIDNLIPIDQPELDLCKLLEGCEGVELWSDIFGKCKLLDTKGDCSYKIEVQVIDKDDDEDGFECFTSDGKFYTGYQNAKCMLWPSETNRDWSTFKKPIKIKEGDPVMVFNEIGNVWHLSKHGTILKPYHTHVVPVKEFDFTDFDSNKSKSII